MSDLIPIDESDVPTKDAAFYDKLRGGASCLSGPPVENDWSETEDETEDEFGDLLDYHVEPVPLPATKALADETDAPEPLPDPHGVAFTDADLARLTDVESEDSVKLAYGLATDAKRALLASDVINGES